MKYLMILTTLLLFTMACKDKQDDLSPFPTNCANVNAFADNPEAVTIQETEIDGDRYYWLNDNSRALDGLEAIILANTCDTVCMIGGLFPTSCDSTYNQQDWTIIWMP